MKANDPHILLALKEYIEQSILGGDIKIEPDTDLKGIGVDSFSLVEILLFIESNFNIQIPDEHLLPENFSTVQRITDIVTRFSA